MCLNTRNKRAISSPSSLSGQRKMDAKHNTKKKVQKIIQDMEFILDNHKTLKEQFGIDVSDSKKISRHFTIANDIPDRHKNILKLVSKIENEMMQEILEHFGTTRRY